MKVINLEGGWQMCVMIDDENHLLIYVSNKDNSNVYEADADPETSREREFFIDLTTEMIEKIADNMLA